MSNITQDRHCSRSDERRTEARYTLILRVGVLEQLGKSSLCLVKNISTMGVQLKCYARPIVDGAASIRVADEPDVLGRIAWVKDGIAGMSFFEELDSNTLLRVRQKLRPNRRRSMPRVGVEATAVLRAGGRTERVSVCDISSIGARVQTRLKLSAGDRAIIELADLPSLQAFVRWSDEEECGVAFNTPIPMQIIADWIVGRVRLSA